MSKRSSKPERPRDPNKIAKLIVEISTQQEKPKYPSKKIIACKILKRLIFYSLSITVPKTMDGRSMSPWNVFLDALRTVLRAIRVPEFRRQGSVSAH